ncbi:MAG: hypothetical protein ACRD2C_17445 [Acidimicrobiales bacterium]
MNDRRDALDYFDVQGSTEMVTRTELMQYIREAGEQISGRNLTFYSSEGLIPAAVRIGSRSGAYPKIVCELLRWIIRSRRQDTSIDAIKQLLPLWVLLAQSRRSGCIDLSEIEHLARAHVTLPAANRIVPLLINDMMMSRCDGGRQKTLWVLKDGTTVISTEHDPLTLSFVLAELDPVSGLGREVAFTQLRLPGIVEVQADDPKTIVLGIPKGIRLCSGSESAHAAARSCATAEREPAACSA